MIITNAKIVTPQDIIYGDILIGEKGKILKIIKRNSGKQVERVHPELDSGVAQLPRMTAFDAKGKYVLPGLIEVHGHMREPGMNQKEDVPHGTRAALAGGFTTIIDMPNTIPPTTTIELLKDKIEKIYSGRSYTDYAFFFGVSKDSLDQLEVINKKDIVGFKVFMAGHETTPTTISDDQTLEKIFAIAAKRGILLAVHAEDQMLINEIAEALKNSARKDPALWSELRSKSVVIRAVKRALKLQEKYKTKTYLLHLSTPEEFSLVQEAKAKKFDVFGELVSYQLNFDTDDYARLGNRIKVSPALRSPQDQNKLWKLLKNVVQSEASPKAGEVEGSLSPLDVLCSEHTPHEWETKNQPDVWKAQSGMPNIQETLPAVLTNWVKWFGKDSIEEALITIAKLSSQNPARIFGFDSKGAIEVGKDADLVVLDTENPWTVSKKDLFSKCGWSAYEGMQLIGRPAATFLRGEMVYNNGKIISKPEGIWLHKK